MGKSFIAGVGTVQFFDTITQQLVAVTKTSTETGFNMGVSVEDITGGNGNFLVGRYYHTSTFGLNITDCQFDMNYLALNAGSPIVASADVMKTETFTVVATNTITVSSTPVAFPSTTNVIGWYKVAGASDDTWTKITFTGLNATVSGLAIGTTVCVTYYYADASARKFTVPASIVPSTVHAIMTVPLFKSGESTSFTSSSQIGEIQVDIPQFQLDGTQDMALTSTGAGQVALSGMALANFGSGCTVNGYYATLTEVINGKDPLANVVSLAVADGDIDLSATYTTETIKVYGIYNDGTTPSILPNSLFTFVSGTPATATVNSAGLVTKVAASGTTNISITATTKPTLSTFAVVTVA